MPDPAVTRWNRGAATLAPARWRWAVLLSHRRIGRRFWFAHTVTLRALPCLPFKDGPSTAELSTRRICRPALVPACFQARRTSHVRLYAVARIKNMAVPTWKVQPAAAFSAGRTAFNLQMTQRTRMAVFKQESKWDLSPIPDDKCHMEGSVVRSPNVKVNRSGIDPSHRVPARLGGQHTPRSRPASMNGPRRLYSWTSRRAFNVRLRPAAQTSRRR